MKFTPEIHKLLMTELINGSSDAAMTTKLMDINVPPELTKGFIERAKELRASAMAMKPTFSSGKPPLMVIPTAAFPEIKRPFVVKQNNKPSITIADKVYPLVFQMDNPHLMLVEDFITPNECDALIEYGKTQFQSAPGVREPFDIGRSRDLRTSVYVKAPKHHNALIKEIDSRIAMLTNWDEQSTEDTYLLNFQIGQEYLTHHDFIEVMEPNAHVHLNNGGNRLGTVIVFLKEPVEGGNITFPESGLTIVPKRGSVLFLGYSEPFAASRSIYSIQPVVSGEEWIAIKWLKERTVI